MPWVFVFWTNSLFGFVLPSLLFLFFIIFFFFFFCVSFIHFDKSIFLGSDPFFLFVSLFFLRCIPSTICKAFLFVFDAFFFALFFFFFFIFVSLYFSFSYGWLLSLVLFFGRKCIPPQCSMDLWFFWPICLRLAFCFKVVFFCPPSLNPPWDQTPPRPGRFFFI